jgi:hypothetical protein
VSVDYELPDLTVMLEATNGKVIDAPTVALGKVVASGP